jgi:hypothetical protein
MPVERGVFSGSALSFGSVNGTAAQTVASEKIIALLIPVFQVVRKLASTFGEGEISGKQIAPPAITAAGDISGTCLGTLSRIVPMVMVCPTTTETALDVELAINFEIVELCRPYPLSCHANTAIP